MPKRKQSETTKPRQPVKGRDPFWRLRRALGEQRRESAKAYLRAAARRAARRAAHDLD